MAQTLLWFWWLVHAIFYPMSTVLHFARSAQMPAERYLQPRSLIRISHETQWNSKPLSWLLFLSFVICRGMPKFVVAATAASRKQFPTKQKDDTVPSHCLINGLNRVVLSEVLYPDRCIHQNHVKNSNLAWLVFGVWISWPVPCRLRPPVALLIPHEQILSALREKVLIFQYLDQLLPAPGHKARHQWSQLFAWNNLLSLKIDALLHHYWCRMMI